MSWLFSVVNDRSSVPQPTPRAYSSVSRSVQSNSIGSVTAPTALGSMAIRVSLSVLGTPRKVRVRWFAFVLASFSPVLEDGGPTVGVEVERPQRSEDERPRGRRGAEAKRCGSSHLPLL